MLNCYLIILGLHWYGMGESNASFPLPEVSISKPIDFYSGMRAFFHARFSGSPGIGMAGPRECVEIVDDLLAPIIHVYTERTKFRNECLRKYTSTTAFTVFKTTYPTTIVWRTQL